MFRKTTEVEILTWLKITCKVKLNQITIYQRKSISCYILLQKCNICKYTGAVPFLRSDSEF